MHMQWIMGGIWVEYVSMQQIVGRALVCKGEHLISSLFASREG